MSNVQMLMCAILAELPYSCANRNYSGIVQHGLRRTAIKCLRSCCGKIFLSGAHVRSALFNLSDLYRIVVNVPAPCGGDLPSKRSENRGIIDDTTIMGNLDGGRRQTIHVNIEITAFRCGWFEEKLQESSVCEIADAAFSLRLIFRIEDGFNEAAVWLIRSNAEQLQVAMGSEKEQCRCRCPG